MKNLKEQITTLAVGICAMLFAAFGAAYFARFIFALLTN
jgi:hypothetical protein